MPFADEYFITTKSTIDGSGLAPRLLESVLALIKATQYRAASSEPGLERTS